MVDLMAEDIDLDIELVSWKMPENAVIPPKPERYKEEGTQFAFELARSLGVPITFQARVMDARAAHEATKIAFRMGIGFAFSRAVFDLKWAEGKDVSDPELLIATAVRLGAEEETFRTVFLSGQGCEDVETDFERCVMNRIWTIPSFSGQGKEIQIHHFKNMPSLEQLKKFIKQGESFFEENQ
jgi:2-hydroxychromene-2-carboxylate isomerase